MTICTKHNAYCSERKSPLQNNQLARGLTYIQHALETMQQQSQMNGFTRQNVNLRTREVLFIMSHTKIKWFAPKLPFKDVFLNAGTLFLTSLLHIYDLKQVASYLEQCFLHFSVDQ